VHELKISKALQPITKCRLLTIADRPILSLRAYPGVGRPATKTWSHKVSVGYIPGRCFKTESRDTVIAGA